MNTAAKLVLTMRRRSRTAASKVQIPSRLKCITRPAAKHPAEIARSVGRNQPQPSPPQYRVSERAAAEETLLRPKSTRTTEGKQHIVARSDEPAMVRQRPLSTVLGLLFPS